MSLMLNSANYSFSISINVALTSPFCDVLVLKWVLRYEIKTGNLLRNRRPRTKLLLEANKCWPINHSSNQPANQLTNPRSLFISSSSSSTLLSATHGKSLDFCAALTLPPPPLKKFLIITKLYIII